MSVVGIDVGARRFHLARLTPHDTKLVIDVVTTVDEAVARCAGATAIAIDAPSEPATGRVHDGDHSPKFAVARCNEIAAGEQLGIWVPWVTPMRDEAPGWMLAGFALRDGLRAAGHEPIEVYPAGCFWLLNGRRWPPRKTTPQGRAARAALLGMPELADRSHDEIDAVMAALVARGPSRAVGHTDDGCDRSTIHVLA